MKLAAVTVRARLVDTGDGGLILEAPTSLPTPATFAIAEPFPVDEYVMVLSGKLILTDADGQVQEFVAGDSLMVPKGFTGTWQMLGNYRELIVVERESYENASKTEEK